MKKYYILPLLFVFLLSFNAQAANNPKLFGHWKNSSVSLKLKSNGQYNYKLNALVKFSGRWTSTKNKIVLHYTLLGVKKQKLVRYTLAKNTLIIKKKDRPSVRLKRVK